MSEQIKAKPKFFYDNGCPICSQYRRLVERKIGDQVEYVPAQQNASDFEYLATDGVKYSGAKAIEALVKDFPAVKDYMWVLPEKYKMTALKAVYKVSSVVRKAYGTVKKGCNCGKH
jgi:phage-related protein